MDLRHISAQIADRADDFLTGAANRREARAGIEELLVADYREVEPDEREAVISAVMEILDHEGFFERGAEGGGAADPGLAG
jgi:hypothetical protein